MRYIGVDLHTTQITVCYLTEKAEAAFRQYGLTDLDEFLSDLRREDEIAVEATGNTSWFYEQVREKVSRVVIVNPHRFEVIKQSANKTDPHDAYNARRIFADE